MNAQATWKEVGRIETKLGSYHAGDAEDSTVTFSLPQQSIPKLPKPIPEANLPADAAPPAPGEEALRPMRNPYSCSPAALNRQKDRVTATDFSSRYSSLN